jgi:hypothetical protein
MKIYINHFLEYYYHEKRINFKNSVCSIYSKPRYIDNKLIISCKNKDTKYGYIYRNAD